MRPPSNVAKDMLRDGSEAVYFGDRIIRKAKELPTHTAQKPASQADVRLAKQIIGMFPWIGKLWSTALHEAGGSSIGRYKVLGILSGRGPIRSGELAHLCASSPSAMSEIIEGLSTERLVRRVDDPTDRRAVVVALTEQGQAELERVGDLISAELVERLELLTADQRSRLRTAVSDVTEILIDPPAKKETRVVR